MIEPILLSSLTAYQLKDYWAHELYINGELITEKMIIKGPEPSNEKWIPTYIPEDF